MRLAQARRRVIRSPVAHEADDVRQRREFAQLEVFVARNTVVLADGRKHLGLLDRVDAEVGLEVQIQLQHVGRVIGLLGNDANDLLFDIVCRGNGFCRSRRCRRNLCDRFGCRHSGRLIGTPITHEADDVRQRRKFAQFEVLVARNAVVLTNCCKHLGLLDRVDAEVGLEIQIEIQHVGRIVGLFGDYADHFLFDVVLRDGRCAGGAGSAVLPAPV